MAEIINSNQLKNINEKLQEIKNKVDYKTIKFFSIRVENLLEPVHRCCENKKLSHIALSTICVVDANKNIRYFHIKTVEKFIKALDKMIEAIDEELEKEKEIDKIEQELLIILGNGELEEKIRHKSRKIARILVEE